MKSAFHADVSVAAIEWDGLPAALVVVRDVTERIRARSKYEATEARRREAHDRLVDAIEAMSEGFALFDADDRIQLYNQRYLEVITSDRADFMRPGLTFGEIIAETVKRGNWHGSDEDLETVVARIHQRHHDLPSEHDIKFPTGHWVRQTKKATREGGVVALYADITDIKEREQVLGESELRHRQLLEAIPDAVVISVDEKIAFVNAASLRLFGAKS